MVVAYLIRVFSNVVIMYRSVSLRHAYADDVHFSIFRLICEALRHVVAQWVSRCSERRRRSVYQGERSRTGSELKDRGRSVWRSLRGNLLLEDILNGGLCERDGVDYALLTGDFRGLLGNVLVCMLSGLFEMFTFEVELVGDLKLRRLDKND